MVDNIDRGIKVLVVEDSPMDEVLLVEELRQAGFKPTHKCVDSRKAMSAALNAEDWDIVCSDYSLPQFSGLEALDVLRESNKDIPFIVISGAIGEDRAVEILRRGAHDFIVKGNWSRLAPAIDRELHEAHVRREKAEADSIIKLRNRQLTSLTRRLLKAHEEERDRLAHDLHDQIGQDLTFIKLGLHLINAIPDSESVSIRHSTLAAVNDLMAKVRVMSLDLGPLTLDHHGLIPALRLHIERYSQETGVTVRLEDKTDRRLPADIETAAFRIVQEMLTNVARHADTKEAFVSVVSDEKQVYLEVADRGKGFDVPLARQSCGTVGISGVFERAALLGGKVELDSAPGQGTRMKVVFPVAHS